MILASYNLDSSRLVGLRQKIAMHEGSKIGAFHAPSSFISFQVFGKNRVFKNVLSVVSVVSPKIRNINKLQIISLSENIHLTRSSRSSCLTTIEPPVFELEKFSGKLF